MVNRDYRDLFAALNAQGAEYLIVGAYAVAVHGHVRATKDIDVWIGSSIANAAKVFRALQLFGAPTEGLAEYDLATPGMMVQLGFEPVRIDILTAIDGIDFQSAWRRRVTAEYGDQSVYVISRDDLLKNKRASARLQDLADLEALEVEPDDRP